MNRVTGMHTVSGCITKIHSYILSGMTYQGYGGGTLSLSPCLTLVLSHMSFLSLDIFTLCTLPISPFLLL